MDSISLDTFFLVFLELPVFSLGPLVQVCTKWYHLLNAERNDSLFWETYYMKHFGGTRKLENWRLSIKSGVNVINKSKTSLSSSIRSAVGLGMDKLLDTLLHQHKIDLSDPNVAREYGYPLHLATGKGDEATIIVLLHHKCDPSLPNHRGKTPKQIAAAQANVGALLLVAPESALTDPELFLTAVKNSRTSVVLELIKIGVDVNYFGSENMAIHLAARNGLQSLIVEFLKRGTPVDVQNKHGLTALQIASQYGKTSLIRFLLKKGADPNYRLKKSRLNSFLCSCNSNFTNQETLELLLGVTTEGVACFDKNQRTVIHFLASRPTLENSLLVELFVVQYGAPVDLPDIRGRTPLQLCISGRPKAMVMVETLCRLGSNPNVGLAEAITYSHHDVVTYLVQMGASVNASDAWNGLPPLFTALERRIKPMVDYLLECGADLYHVTPDGRTALNCLAHPARNYYHQELDFVINLAKQIIQVLGVDVTLPESDPHHILDDALTSGQYNLAYLLIRAGGGAKVHRDILHITNVALVAELLHRKLCPLPEDHLFAMFHFYHIGPSPEMAMLLWYLGADPGHRSENYNNLTIFEYDHGYPALKEALDMAAKDPEYPVLLLRQNNLLGPTDSEE